MLTQFRVAVVVLLSLLVVGCGSDSDEGPSSDEISTALELQLPRYLDIKDLEVEVSENTGTEVSPNVGSRFNGTLVVNSPLYESSEELAGKTVLAVEVEEGKELQVFGVSRATKSLDQWDVTFEEFEISPTVESSPIEAFTDYVIESSPEHQALVKEVEAEKAAIEKTRTALLGSWSGTYFCDGTERGVDWNVTSNGEALSVTKRFYPLDDEDELKEGSYLADLNVDGTDLELAPIEWIGDSPGFLYSMLAAKGTIDVDTLKISGTIEKRSCTEFSLTKS